jgi:hypothetical protein
VKANIKEPDVVAVFTTVVDGTQKMIDGRPAETAVDIRLTFSSIRITDSGIPVVWKKREESTMEIVFATRLVPQRLKPAP